MKHLKLFEDKFRIDPPKLEGPKVVGKINLDSPKSRNIDLDIEIPANFQEEIVRKVEAYFQKYPRIDQESYVDDRVTSILDINNVGKTWDPIHTRLKRPQAKPLFQNKKYFRFDKKWNSWTMLGSWFLPDGNLKTTLLNLYGPIKGETGHGDFYFTVTHGVYYVYTKHALERYWQRKMGRTPKSLTPDEIKETMKDWMTNYMDLEFRTGKDITASWDPRTGKQVTKMDGGAFIGEIKKETKWICIQMTFYTDDMLKPSHRKLMEQE